MAHEGKVSQYYVFFSLTKANEAMFFFAYKQVTSRRADTEPCAGALCGRGRPESLRSLSLFITSGHL